MATIRSTARASGKQIKVREIRYPIAGVVRRNGQESTVHFAEPYPSPWAVNCRTEDTIHRRYRGGSRPGLAAYSTAYNGQNIRGMVSVGGSTPKLVVISSSMGTLSCTPFVRGIMVYGVASTIVKILNSSTNAVTTLTPTVGTVPTGITHGCMYLDRLVLAGYDNAIYMSRQGTPTDWNYGASVADAGRAVVFQLGEASEIGEICTALMPFKDQSLLATTARAIWLIQGDPASNGSLRNISRGVGCVGPRAWCPLTDARVGDAMVKYGFVFLSATGLYLIDPTGDGLTPLSENLMPEDLRAIPTTTIVSMVFSPEERGVHIYLKPTSGTSYHYFFDLVHKGFWPDYLQSAHTPTAACWFNGLVLLAGTDGDIRKIDYATTTDNGTAIQSHLLIGPLRLSSANTFGIVTMLNGMVANGSGSVAWNIVGGNTAEDACINGKAAIEAYLAGSTAVAMSYVQANGTWTASRSMNGYPRVRAMWICIWLRSTAQWAYEGVTIESTDGGRWR